MVTDNQHTNTTFSFGSKAIFTGQTIKETKIFYDCLNM